MRIGIGIMDTLSKKDFQDLGCEDVSGPQLRARVFQLEGLVAEMALTLEECRPLIAYHISNGGTNNLRTHSTAVLQRIREAISIARNLMPLNNDSVIIPDGTPGMRDVNSPCEYFQPGEPSGLTCEGDGHYLCNECEEKKP